MISFWILILDPPNIVWLLLQEEHDTLVYAQIELLLERLIGRSSHHLDMADLPILF